MYMRCDGAIRNFTFAGRILLPSRVSEHDLSTTERSSARKTVRARVFLCKREREKESRSYEKESHAKSFVLGAEKSQSRSRTNYSTEDYYRRLEHRSMARIMH